MTSSAPVISPVVIGDFTCAGNGLLYEGHARESPAQLRALILPTGNRNGISDRDRPKSWWLAQNKFYGLAQAKATPIGTLRSKLEEALRSRNGMSIPENILNLEGEGNRKYQDLLQVVLEETQKRKKKANKGLDSNGNGTAGTSKQATSRIVERNVPSKAGKATAVPARKRGRSPERAETSNKRVRSGDDEEFGWLTGTYSITKADVLHDWDDWEWKDLELVIQLDSDRRLVASFNFHVVEGAMQSSADIQARADGAAAKIDWCGQQGENFERDIYAPMDVMKGNLRFTRKKRDGRHTVTGKIEHVEAIGVNIEFTAERSGDAGALTRNWEGYSWDVADEAEQIRSRIVEAAWGFVRISD